MSPRPRRDTSEARKPRRTSSVSTAASRRPRLVELSQLFGPQASNAVPPEGLVGVHTYLQVDPGTGPPVVDATFPLYQPWDGTSPMPLRCAEGLDVTGGPSPAKTKQQLVRLHCDPRVREPFIACLLGEPIIKGRCQVISSKMQPGP